MARFLCLDCDFTAADGELEICIRCGSFSPYVEGGLAVCDDCFKTLR